MHIKLTLLFYLLIVFLNGLLEGGLFNNWWLAVLLFAVEVISFLILFDIYLSLLPKIIRKHKLKKKSEKYTKNDVDIRLEGYNIKKWAIILAIYTLIILIIIIDTATGLGDFLLNNYF